MRTVMGQTSFLILKIILLQIFLDSFKSRDYIYNGNIFEPVPPCKPSLCFVYTQFDEDLLPLWLQAKTFLLSRETVRAFLSFKNRNINLDQCQSFFPLCLQLVTHLCLLFPLKTQTSQKHCVWMSRYDARGGSMLRVLYRSLSCEDTCWADVHQPSDTHIMSQTNRRETRSILVTCETENKNHNSIFVCRQHGWCLILSRCFYF